MKNRTAYWIALSLLTALNPIAYVYALDATGEKEKAVLVLDEERDTALIHEDFATLDKILGDDLTYVHASGLLEGKAEFLADLKSNKRRYISIHNSDEHARTLNGTVIITARSEIRLVHDGKESNLSLRVTEVYAKRRSGWQLVAYESTHLAQ